MNVNPDPWNPRITPPVWNVDTPSTPPNPDPDRDDVLRVVRGEAEGVGEALDEMLDDLAPANPRQRLTVISSLCGMSLLERTGTVTYPPRFAFNDLVLERTVHVPLVFMGPMLPALGRIDQPVELVDLMPTLLAQTPAMPPAALPGQDLLAAHPTPEAAPYAYMELGDMLSIRQG